MGDRYFGKAAHREAGVTVIAAESLPPGVGLAHGDAHQAMNVAAVAIAARWSVPDAGIWELPPRQ
ncbi:hypothetical protein [Micromonospora sp. LOL_024]|uniref:hypothetical protein n=1 Tax=Micromonospora sp. LOL_024 TaxID=3345412 RepID=UPI003A89690A